MGKTESGSFKYVGFNIKQDPQTFAVSMDQEEYAERIEMIKSPQKELLRRATRLLLRRQQR